MNRIVQNDTFTDEISSLSHKVVDIVTDTVHQVVGDGNLADILAAVGMFSVKLEHILTEGTVSILSAFNNCSFSPYVTRFICDRLSTTRHSVSGHVTSYLKEAMLDSDEWQDDVVVHDFTDALLDILQVEMYNEVGENLTKLVSDYLTLLDGDENSLISAKNPLSSPEDQSHQ